MHMSSFFKAVLVTGARQVGKATMLKHLSEGQGRTYVTLDNLMARNFAQTDPVLFFQTYKPPIIIDEVQYAPQLFEQIKVMCDESEETGRFWLTGSQQYQMMNNIRETLAGRISILELYSLSKNLAATMVRQIMPEFQEKKNVIILCDSWYVKKNLVSIVEDFTLSDEKIGD